MRNPPNSFSVISPAQYVAMAKRWWWMLTLIPLLAAGSAYWLSARQAPNYSASATLFVSQASPSSADVTAAKLLTKTYSQLVTSRPVLERVISSLGLPRTVPELSEQISTGMVVDTQIIRITVVDTDPQMAANIANATGTAFVNWIAEQQSSTVQQSAGAVQDDLSSAVADIERVSAELAALRAQQGTPTAEDGARIVSLEAELRQHQSRYAGLLDLQQRFEFTPQSRVLLTAPAEPPAGPDGPNPLRNAALAFLVDLAVMVLGIVLFERLIDRVRLPDDVQRKVDLPVLGMIPRSRRKAEVEIVAAPYSAMSEAIRSLRATLQFAASGRKIGALVIASPGSHEGKSVISANLAAAFAQAGHRVVLVDGDLRRPRQHELFATPNQGGLSEVLSQPLAVSEASVAGVPAARRRGSERRPKAGLEHALVNSSVPGLQVLVAGTSTKNPSELLTDEHLEHLMADLKQVADVVVIDAPPLLGVSDTLLLAAAADHALIIVEAGQTRSEALRMATATIGQTKVNVLGIVLNGTENTRDFTSYLPYNVATDQAEQKQNGHSVPAASIE